MSPLLALSWPNLPCALKADIGSGKRDIGNPRPLIMTRATACIRPRPLSRVEDSPDDHPRQVRFAYSKFLTNQFQVVGSVAHDVSVTGGFKKDVEALFRALYTWR